MDSDDEEFSASNFIKHKRASSSRLGEESSRAELFRGSTKTATTTTTGATTKTTTGTSALAAKVVGGVVGRSVAAKSGSAIVGNAVGAAAASATMGVLASASLSSAGGAKSGGASAGGAWEAEEEDSELRHLRTEQDKVRLKSVESTRASVQRITEAVDIARGSMQTLRSQSEQLDRIEEDLIAADQNVETAYHSAKELKKYSGLIPISFRNLFGGKKKKEGDREYERKMKALYKQEEKDAKRREKEKKKSGVSMPNLVLADDGDDGDDGDDKENKEDTGRGRRDDPKKKKKNTSGSSIGGSSKKDDSKSVKITFNDDPDAEIDHNLDVMLDSVQRLKVMSLTMLDEMDYQDRQIDRLNATNEHVGHLLDRTTRKLHTVS